MKYNLSRIFASVRHGLRVEILNEIDSTNSEMKRRIKKDPHDCPDVLVALCQTAGRGRMGKSFFSPTDSGIYATLRASLAEANDIVYVTTKTAVAVCKAVRAITGRNAMIKWVNDIYIDGKKVCGILCERLSGGTEDNAEIIIGIGVNMTAVSYPKDIPNPGALGCDDFDGMLSEIVNNVYHYIYERDNFSYIEEYREMSCVLGKNIIFFQDGVSFSGKAQSIDSSGYLTVSDSDGREYVLKSGEISLRLKD